MDAVGLNLLQKSLRRLFDLDDLIGIMYHFETN